jgi:aldehyde:ferredoxin oxidoreductase
MNGHYGKILRINLTDSSFREEEIDEAIYTKYLGGKGLASYLLFEFNPPGVDPLSPDNCLIFATGPITGSRIWGSSRYGVFTKSPQTKLYSESYSGGKVPEAIDSTGYDAIVIQGASETPVALEITPETVLFHEAGELWGKETYETEELLINQYGKDKGAYKKSGTVVIGPAAENGVCFGVIKNDKWRSAGRTGVGTVLGSKKVKGLVFKGDCKRPVYSEELVKEISKKILAVGKENPGAAAYKSMGTSQLVKVTNGANAFPTRYWSEGTYDKWENISAEALHSRCDVVPTPCAKCFMACGRMTTIKEGRHAGMKIEGPEYETIYAFGGLCLIDSIEEIAYLNDVCDRLGMDTISAGNLCAFTVEASKRGKIDYSLEYGDVDGFAKLLAMISKREGIGDVLARGIKYAAKKWDLEDIAVHVKGMEPAGYEPRTLKGMGLAFATSDRGACHLRATFYKPELSGMIPPGQIEGKAKLFLEFEDRLTVFDALIFCRFFRDMYDWEELGEAVHAVTGLDADKESLRVIAKSITDVVRKFNVREGLTPEDDWLPPKLFTALEDSGNVIKPEELEYMRREYYEMRGWDAQGVPK